MKKTKKVRGVRRRPLQPSHFLSSKTEKERERKRETGGWVGVWGRATKDFNLASSMGSFISLVLRGVIS